MSPVGGGKPLFDLISSGRRADGAPPPASPAARGEAGTRSVTLPMVWIYAGVGLVLLLLVGGYGVGYQLGTSATREAERRAAARDAERVFVDDPLRAAPSPDDAPGGGGSASRSAGETARTTPVRPSGGVLLSDGRTGPDPRLEGLNYLELVTLNRVRAAEAVRYLSANGEDAIAVPLDRRGSGSNTSDSFRVIAMGLAVPGDTFRSSGDARRRFEERLARLGRTWADEGGASDFSDPLWRKFGG